MRIDTKELSGLQGFTLNTREYEGESHISVGLTTLVDGIGLLYPGAPGAGARPPGS